MFIVAAVDPLFLPPPGSILRPWSIPRPTHDTRRKPDTRRKLEDESQLQPEMKRLRERPSEAQLEDPRGGRGKMPRTRVVAALEEKEKAAELREDRKATRQLREKFEEAEITTREVSAQGDPALATSAPDAQKAELRTAQATAHADELLWQKLDEAGAAAAAAVAEAEAGAARTIGELHEALVALEGKLEEADVVVAQMLQAEVDEGSELQAEMVHPSEKPPERNEAHMRHFLGYDKGREAMGKLREKFEGAEITAREVRAQRDPTLAAAIPKDPALAASAPNAQKAELRTAQATAHADELLWQKLDEAEAAAAAAVAEAEAGAARTMGELHEMLVALEGKLKEAEEQALARADGAGARVEDEDKDREQRLKESSSSSEGVAGGRSLSDDHQSCLAPSSSSGIGAAFQEVVIKPPVALCVPFIASEQAHVESFVNFFRGIFSSETLRIAIENERGLVKVTAGGRGNTSKTVAWCVEFGLRVCREGGLKPCRFSLVRARLANDDEDPEMSPFLMESVSHESSQKTSKLRQLASVYGVMATYVDSRDLRCPEPSDEYNSGGGGGGGGSGGVVPAEHEGGPPRYYAPPRLAAMTKGRILQLFGPEHCVKLGLERLTGWTMKKENTSLALGSFVMSNYDDLAKAGTAPGKNPQSKLELDKHDGIVHISSSSPAPCKKRILAVMNCLVKKPHLVQKVDTIDASFMRNVASPAKLREWARLGGAREGAIQVLPVWQIPCVLVLNTEGSVDETAVNTVSGAISEAAEQWQQSHISILLEFENKAFTQTGQIEHGMKGITPVFVQEISQALDGDLDLDLDLWLDGLNVRGLATSRTNEEKVRSEIEKKYPKLLPRTVPTEAAAPSANAGEASRGPKDVATAAGPQCPSDTAGGAAGSAPELTGDRRHNLPAGERSTSRAVGINGGRGQRSQFTSHQHTTLPTLDATMGSSSDGGRHRGGSDQPRTTAGSATQRWAGNWGWGSVCERGGWQHGQHHWQQQGGRYSSVPFQQPQNQHQHHQQRHHYHYQQAYANTPFHGNGAYAASASGFQGMQQQAVYRQPISNAGGRGHQHHGQPQGVTQPDGYPNGAGSFPC